MASCSPVLAPEGTADLVLFLRNLHNWMAAGIAEKAFHDAFAALKPGGTYIVLDHTAAAGSGFDATESLHRVAMKPALMGIAEYSCQIRHRLHDTGFVIGHHHGD